MIMVIMMMMVAVVSGSAAWRYKTMRGGRRGKVKGDAAGRHVYHLF